MPRALVQATMIPQVISQTTAKKNLTKISRQLARKDAWYGLVVANDLGGGELRSITNMGGC